MVKRCQWGKCNSDDRYPERLEGGIKFIPFPKPKTYAEKCMLWIRRCNGPADQLNVNKINRNSYVCTKHFVEGKPTEKYPNPVQCTANTVNIPPTPSRPAPSRKRSSTRPPRKRKKILQSDKDDQTETRPTDVDQQPECSNTSIQSPAASAPSISGPSALDMLALASENKKLQEMLSKALLENEELRRREYMDKENFDQEKA